MNPARFTQLPKHAAASTLLAGSTVPQGAPRPVYVRLALAVGMLCLSARVMFVLGALR